MIRLANDNASRKPLGGILYQGPSELDGKPIVVIATGFQRPSANEKTGNMLQTWTLRADVNPLEAIHTGQVFSYPTSSDAKSSASWAKHPNAVWSPCWGVWIVDMSCSR